MLTTPKQNNKYNLLARSVTAGSNNDVREKVNINRTVKKNVNKKRTVMIRKEKNMFSGIINNAFFKNSKNNK